MNDKLFVVYCLCTFLIFHVYIILFPSMNLHKHQYFVYLNVD